MSDWRDLSIENLHAAQVLHAGGYARSAASRAYFAAYAAVTSNLTRRVTFGAGRENPPHAILPQIVQSNAASHLGVAQRRTAARLVRKLQASRVASDYDPTTTVDRTTSLQSLREAAHLLQLLEVN